MPSRGICDFPSDLGQQQTQAIIATTKPRKDKTAAVGVKIPHNLSLDTAAKAVALAVGVALALAVALGVAAPQALIKELKSTTNNKALFTPAGVAELNSLDIIYSPFDFTNSKNDTLSETIFLQ